MIRDWFMFFPSLRAACFSPTPETCPLLRFILLLREVVYPISFPTRLTIGLRATRIYLPLIKWFHCFTNFTGVITDLWPSLLTQWILIDYVADKMRLMGNFLD